MSMQKIELDELTKKWVERSQEIKTKIASAELEGDGHKQAQLMREYLQLQREIAEHSKKQDL